jgi:hypothetical protein
MTAMRPTKAASRKAHDKTALAGWRLADRARVGERWLLHRKTSIVVQDVCHPALTPVARAGLRTPDLAVHGEHSKCAATLPGSVRRPMRALVIGHTTVAGRPRCHPCRPWIWPVGR